MINMMRMDKKGDTFYCGFTDIWNSVATLGSGDYRGTSCWMACDSQSRSLYIVPLTPGFFPELMRVAMRPTFARIFIIPPTTNVLMISDLTRAVLQLRTVKKEVCIVYPKHIISKTIKELDTQLVAWIAAKSKCTTHFVDEYRSNLLPEYDISTDNIIVDFIELVEDQPYSIKVTLNGSSIYFITYLNSDGMDKLKEVVEGMETWDSILLPYRMPPFGGYSMYDLLQNDFFPKKLYPRLAAYDFTCTEEYTECISKFGIGIPGRLVI